MVADRALRGPQESAIAADANRRLVAMWMMRLRFQPIRQHDHAWHRTGKRLERKYDRVGVPRDRTIHPHCTEAAGKRDDDLQSGHVRRWGAKTGKRELQPDRC